MGKEIERKFLLKDTGFLEGHEGIFIVQSYFAEVSAPEVRIRIEGGSAFLTIKGSRSGSVRDEFEYGIPVADAQEIMQKYCIAPAITKMRYLYSYEGLDWEIDIFQNENHGLSLAEIELNNEFQEFPRPPWLGDEVTDDKQYYNRQLIRNPYRNREKLK
jgi:adenylate cyclase